MRPMSTDQNGSLLVTGASGLLGKRVIELLLASGEKRPIIATTRSPEKLADLAARGVIVRSADFDDEAALVKAFAGAERILLISTDALDRPGHRIAQHQAAVRAAKAAGAKHVVYTSLPKPGPESVVTIAPDHRETEAAIVASGLGYTLLRNNLYMELLLHSLPHAVAVGKLVNASGSGAIGYVSREDCARAAAAALVAPFSGKQTLDVTGPAAVTQVELARIASAVTGRPVDYVPVEAAVAQSNLEAAGLPPPVAELYVSFEVATSKGQLDVVSSTVSELTGQAPVGLADFLTKHRSAIAPV